MFNRIDPVRTKRSLGRYVHFRLFPTDRKITNRRPRAAARDGSFGIGRTGVASSSRNTFSTISVVTIHDNIIG